MKIYVSHSRRFDFEQDLYEPLKHSDLAKIATFIFPQEDGAPYHDSKEIIKHCKFLIAEVTHPSTGVGVEVAWADQYHIPIIAIAKTGVHMSQSVRNLATHFIEYDSESELIERLQEIIKH